MSPFSKHFLNPILERVMDCNNKCVWHSLRFHVFFIFFSPFIFLGHPNQAVVTSRDNSYYSDHYNVTWSVHSFSKITEYRISYRKAIVSKIDVLNVVINEIMSNYYVQDFATYLQPVIYFSYIEKYHVTFKCTGNQFSTVAINVHYIQVLNVALNEGVNLPRWSFCAGSVLWPLQLLWYT